MTSAGSWRTKRWQTGVRAEMECYTNMLLLMQDIEEDEDWGPEIFEENEDDELSDDV